jgi:hypothetical protein
LAVAPMSLTPRGGRHYFFRQPTGCKLGLTVGKLAPHVDTRADDGYVVVAPSKLDGGRVYKWAAGTFDDPPDKLPLPPFWLLSALLTAPKAKGLPHAEAAAKIPEGQRNDALFRLGIRMRKFGHSAEEIAACLHVANQKRCTTPLEAREIETIAASCGRCSVGDAALAELEQAAPDDPPSLSARIGKFPEHLFCVPGFIGDVMAYTLETAHKRQPELSLAAALCLMGTLTGRKIRDRYDTRTNLYALGVCPSGGGKDRPRQVNKAILYEAEAANMIAPDGFKSDTAIVNELEHYPVKLTHWDEFAVLLQTVNKSNAGAYLANIPRVLMTLYTSANGMFLSDGVADREKKNKVIKQPHLSIFATCCPSDFYAALTKTALTNGFMGRALVFESSDPSPEYQDAPIQPVPPEIIEVAKYWATLSPGGNLDILNPAQIEVGYTPEAADMLMQCRQWCRQEEQSGGDEVIRCAWSRACEKIQTLALLYACSADHYAPVIDGCAFRWASEVVDYLTRKMLENAGLWVVETAFESARQKVLKIILDRPGITKTQLLQATRGLKQREREEIVTSLVNAGDVEEIITQTTGRPRVAYKARVK